jgi:hypothetical protein
MKKPRDTRRKIIWSLYQLCLPLLEKFSRIGLENIDQWCRITFDWWLYLCHECFFRSLVHMLLTNLAVAGGWVLWLCDLLMLGRTILFGLMGSILVLIGTSQSSFSVPALEESFAASLSHDHACLCSWTPTTNKKKSILSLYPNRP